MLLLCFIDYLFRSLALTRMSMLNRCFSSVNILYIFSNCLINKSIKYGTWYYNASNCVCQQVCLHFWFHLNMHEWLVHFFVLVCWYWIIRFMEGNYHRMWVVDTSVTLLKYAYPLLNTALDSWNIILLLPL